MRHHCLSLKLIVIFEFMLIFITIDEFQMACFSILVNTIIFETKDFVGGGDVVFDVIFQGILILHVNMIFSSPNFFKVVMIKACIHIS